MSYFYASSIFKSPSIVSTIKVDLEVKNKQGVNEIKPHLLVAKNNNIEFMEITKNGIKSGKEITVFGNLIYITPFTSIHSKSVDYFFLLDEDLRFAMVKWENGNFISKKEGEVVYKNCELIEQDYKIIKGYPIQ